MSNIPLRASMKSYPPRSPRKAPLRQPQSNHGDEVIISDPDDEESTPTGKEISVVRQRLENLYAPYCKVQIPGVTKDNASAYFLKVKLNRMQERGKKDPSLGSLVKLVSKHWIKQRQDLYHQGAISPSSVREIPPFVLQYHDDTGNTVNLVSDQDLQDALKHPPRRGLKLLIQSSEKEETQPSKQPPKRKSRATRTTNERGSRFSSTESSTGISEQFAQVPMMSETPYSPRQSMTLTSGLTSEVPFRESIAAARTKARQTAAQREVRSYRQHRPPALAKTSKMPSHRPVSNKLALSPMSVPTFANNSQNLVTNHDHTLDACQIDMALHRRPNANVRIGLSVILDADSCASYWRLVRVATQAFHIPIGTQIALFCQKNTSLQPHSRRMQEVRHDLDLSEELALLAGTPDPVLQVHVIDSTVMIGKQDGSLLEVPLGSVMDPTGLYSFAKLLNYARMANPTKPVQGLTYLSNNGKQTLHDRECMKNSFVHDINNATSRQPAMVLHPVYQANPLKLKPEDATLHGECSFAEDPPRIRLLNSNSVAYWNVSFLAPGRYEAHIHYYRGKAIGSVTLFAGIVDALPAKQQQETATMGNWVSTLFTPTQQNDSDLAEASRKLFPDPYFLPATGKHPCLLNNFGTAELGEFEVESPEDQHNKIKGINKRGALNTSDHSNDETTTNAKELPPTRAWFMLVAENSSNPLMSVQDVELTFLGI